MTDAVTAGCFSDFKLVKTRNVAQLVIELPLERADEALELLGGLPRPSREVWVAVARLTDNPFTEAAKPTPAPETPTAPAVEPERHKRDVTMAQRAALFCQEKDARGQNLAATFFAERYPHEWQEVELSIPQADHDRADACLKYILGIKSKRELDTDIDAATAFQRISRELFRWRNEEAA